MQKNPLDSKPVSPIRHSSRIKAKGHKRYAVDDVDIDIISPFKELKVDNSPAAACMQGLQSDDDDEILRETRYTSVEDLKTRHKVNLTEIFFLQNNGNMLDYSAWLTNPTTQLMLFLKTNVLDPSDHSDSKFEQLQASITPSASVKLESPASEAVAAEPVSQLKQELDVDQTSSIPALPLSIHLPTTSSEPGTSPVVKDEASLDAIVASPTTQEGIAERAKQEASTLSRIGDLRKDGMWSARRLPKCVDPVRSKTHWDYLLEEMRWMAIDFTQEKRWKRIASKKLALLAAKVKRDEEEQLKRESLEKERELKRISNAIAKEVRLFWKNLGKVVDFKAKTVFEEKRRKALDSHLDFIVGQTEKFSTWLQEGLNRPLSSVGETCGSVAQTPSAGDRSQAVSDEDFDDEAIESESDDERTIAKAEKADEDVKSEVEKLQAEVNMDLDDILASLPPGYLENRDRPLTPQDSEKFDSDNDDAYPEEENNEDDDSSVDSKNNDEQKRDASPGISELLEAEGGTAGSAEAETAEKVVDFSKLQSEYSEERGKELDNIAEAAEKFHPTGFTLETTRVVTKVPFLLKHTLREYQHVGLDWLVTLQERNLNGILADEMGLGKTIQTIALLAHLACEKENWGPHLIVVPTSVMLNWEMELKKWCPGFKILTYYGSPKERAEKRKGWTRPDAFHVCITSYKLVLQDHRSFRAKKWVYLILDEAQHIKNFKSQRWQLLLNFNSDHRLLLTGTPLQNNLIELWSLMHFLMPQVFTSHRDFREWFANPLTGMIEGTNEYNESLIRRLHKVLRPFLLRRLKSEVEKQLPKKYEHLVMCPLSRRQRFLYDDFMSRGSTKDELHSGSIMSVLNILMQLRKVCNHPNLFEVRSIVSPFVTPPLCLKTASLATELKYERDWMMNKFGGIADRESDSLEASKRCLQLAANSQVIREINNRVAQLRPPKFQEFDFRPMQPPLPFADENVRAVKLSDMKAVIGEDFEQKLRFIIPTTVAQHIDFDKPVMIQIKTSRGLELIPLILSAPSAKKRSMAKHSLSTLSPSSAVPAGHIPVLQLVPSILPTRPPTVQLVSSIPLLPAQPIPASFSSGTGLPSPLEPFGPGTSSSRFASPVESRVSEVTPASTQLAQIKSTTQRYDDAKTSGSGKDKESSATDDEPLAGKLAEDENVSESVKAHRRKYELSHVKERRRQWHEISLRRLAIENTWRCVNLPVIGEDVRESVTLPDPMLRLTELMPLTSSDLIIDESRRLERLRSLMERFIMHVPKVKADQEPVLFIRHPAPWIRSSCELREHTVRACMTEVAKPYHMIMTNGSIQFPELRLIEYDCGKLQTLARLLRDLKIEGHRCLIFTQMSKVLDILEAFLSYHGYKYVRLDGSTRIEQRQILMEQFNQDARIFCFILSTRSGGVGVNLTGADTVIFYDSDWNPTMDAQAQDRCHRIGQTRDVNIYRLISEKTVEENIWKKANQKRLLGEIAIEEGKFTADFFKQGTLRELFDQDVAQAVEQQKSSETEPVVPELSSMELEKVFENVEDASDAAAAKKAKAEIEQEDVEFDESTPLDDVPAPPGELSKAELEIQAVIEQLTPIERYAVRMIEAGVEHDAEDELFKIEVDVEAAKLKWEQDNLMSMQEEERKVNMQESEEHVLHYPLEDSLNQVNPKALIPKNIRGKIRPKGKKQPVSKRKSSFDKSKVDAISSNNLEDKLIRIDDETGSTKRRSSPRGANKCNSAANHVTTTRSGRRIVTAPFPEQLELLDSRSPKRGSCSRNDNVAKRASARMSSRTGSRVRVSYCDETMSGSSEDVTDADSDLESNFDVENFDDLIKKNGKRKALKKKINVSNNAQDDVLNLENYESADEESNSDCDDDEGGNNCDDADKDEADRGDGKGFDDVEAGCSDADDANKSFNDESSDDNADTAALPSFWNKKLIIRTRNAKAVEMRIEQPVKNVASAHEPDCGIADSNSESKLALAGTSSLHDTNVRICSTDVVETIDLSSDSDENIEIDGFVAEGRILTGFNSPPSNLFDRMKRN